MKKLLMLVVAIGMLAGGACRADTETPPVDKPSLRLGLEGFGPGAILSWKETSSTKFARLEPCVAFTLASLEDMVFGNAGFKGRQVADSVFEQVDFIGSITVDTIAVIDRFTDLEVKKAVILRNLTIGPYGGIRLNQLDKLDDTLKSPDYGLQFLYVIPFGS